ncbi:MAG: hypothetical protein PHU63_02160 [Candidatus ainarchaeum sp.]|nr:hypothetical protein [Candidatus ainarchaeum sp.]
MGEVRKGVLLTFSILLLASSFIYLLSATSEYSNSIKQNTKIISDFESIDAQYDSISNGIKKIALTEEVEITFYENNISIGRNIEYSNQYEKDLYRFVQFVELFGLMDNSVDITDAKKPKMTINPQDIDVEFFENKTTVTTQDFNASKEIEGYQVIILTSAYTPIFNWKELNEIPESDPNSIYFHLGFQGSNLTYSETKYLDRTKNNEIQLLNMQSNGTMISVELKPGSNLVVVHNLDMYLNIIIGLNKYAEIELGKNIVNVSMGEDARKIGKVILGES